MIATDSSGRTGEDKSRIIIVPTCKKRDKKAGICEIRGSYNDYYLNRSNVSSIVDTSLVRYELDSMSLTWKDGLGSVMTAPPTLS